MDVTFGTSCSIQTRIGRFNNKFILRIAPIYRTFVCFWFTFAFLGGGRSFRLTERRSGLALKNFAKVLLLFQIPKDTVFSYAGAPLSNVRVAFLKTLLFLMRQFLYLSTPLCLLYLQIIKSGLLLMKLQCKGSTFFFNGYLLYKLNISIIIK